MNVIENASEDVYLGVASFYGPDWWFVTIYPRSYVRSRAHGAAAIVMIESVLLSIVVLIVVVLVVRNRVGRPLSILREGAVALGEKRYDEVAGGELSLPTDVPNEVGLFAVRFVEMARRSETPTGTWNESSKSEPPS